MHSCDCPCCVVYGPGDDNYGRDTEEKVRERAKAFAAELPRDLATKKARAAVRKLLRTWPPKLEGG